MSRWSPVVRRPSAAPAEAVGLRARSRSATGDCRQRTNRWRLKTSAALLILLLVASPSRAALSEATRLAAVYDAILDARFDQAESRLRQACPPAPVEACAALRAVSLWWQILLDPENRQLDERLNTLAAAAVAACDAWTKREPQRAEAWFYLAGSFAPLVQWRVLRGERLAAAREGNKIRESLERALQLDPTLDDAHFGIGLYHYYADVAPAAARIVRWLLFLPGGDRVKGLQEMLQTRERGALLRGEADYQLHLIYLWYERKPARAVELLEQLDGRYPFNPLFLQRVAEVEDEWLHDRPASAAAWETLLERAREGQVHNASRAEITSRLGLAEQLDALYETDRAIDQLTIVTDAKPSVASRLVLERAYLRLGLAYDRIGQRALAVKAYMAALEQAPGRESPLRSRARDALGQSPDAKLAQAYRLSLEGWRAFERAEIDQARSSMARAIDLNPADEVLRYRYARVLDARGDAAGARAHLETVIAARTTPAFVLAAAYADYARLLERAGDRARAIEAYRHATQVVGGDRRARDQARAALARLGG